MSSILSLLGWSVLLGRKSLKRASKQLKDMCSWRTEVPTILSACLVSIEPDSHLRLMSDQFTPDERFGQTASHCTLSTPKDASATHVLVFPTSATAQVQPKSEYLMKLHKGVCVPFMNESAVLFCFQFPTFTSRKLRKAPRERPTLKSSLICGNGQSFRISFKRGINSLLVHWHTQSKSIS